MGPWIYCTFYNFFEPYVYVAHWTNRDSSLKNFYTMTLPSTINSSLYLFCHTIYKKQYSERIGKETNKKLSQSSFSDQVISLCNFVVHILVKLVSYWVCVSEYSCCFDPIYMDGWVGYPWCSIWKYQLWSFQRTDTNFS